MNATVERKQKLRIGLNVRWWEWDDLCEKVEDLSRKSEVLIWQSRVDKVLKLNVGTPFASSWKELRKRIRLNQKHGARHRTRTVPRIVVRHRYASALGVDNHDLSPSTQEIIAVAARLLTRTGNSTRTTLSERDTLAYAAYCLRTKRTNSTNLCPESLDALLPKFKSFVDEQQLRESILIVAERVGEILLTDSFAPLLALISEAGEIVL